MTHTIRITADVVNVILSSEFCCWLRNGQVQHLCKGRFNQTDSKYINMMWVPVHVGFIVNEVVRIFKSRPEWYPIDEYDTVWSVLLQVEARQGISAVDVQMQVQTTGPTIDIEYDDIMYDCIEDDMYSLARFLAICTRSSGRSRTLRRHAGAA
jgi:hypothetical protein